LKKKLPQPLKTKQPISYSKEQRRQMVIAARQKRLTETVRRVSNDDVQSGCLMWFVLFLLVSTLIVFLLFGANGAFKWLKIFSYQ
jgi:hypothetical protein